MSKQTKQAKSYPINKPDHWIRKNDIVATYIVSPTGEQMRLLVAYSMMQPLEMHDIRIVHPPAPARLKVATSDFLRAICRIEVR